MSSSLRVLQWNAKSLRNKHHELQNFIVEHDPHIISICETWLFPALNFNFQGYRSVRKDRDTLGGGVMILIKNNLPFTQQPLPPTQLEAVAVNIYPATHPISVVSFYDPSGSTPIADYESIAATLKPSFLFTGDANAHHPAWGSPRPDQQGMRIVDWMLDTPAILLNTGDPTYLHYDGTTTHLDLTICSSSLFLGHVWKVLQAGSSDHCPIISTFDLGRAWANNIDSTFRVYQKADWDKFSSRITTLFEHPATSQGSLDGDVNQFTQLLLAAADDSIPLRTCRQGRPPGRRWWTPECEEAVRDKRRARTTAADSGFYHHQVAFRAAVARCRRVIRQAKAATRESFISSVSSPSELGKVWRFARNFNTSTNHSIPALQVPGEQPTTTAEGRARVLMDQFFPSDQGPPAQTRDAINNTPDGPPLEDDAYNSPFTMEELELTLKGLKPSAPGPDNIHNLMLKNLTFSARTVLLSLLNRSWSTGEIPKAWLSSWVIPLLKAGKPPHLPSSYRPIALSSCLLKLLERLVNRRLTWVAEKNNALSACQHGFRRGRSTVQPLIDLRDDMVKALASNLVLTVVFLDIKRAFDGIWHETILARLRSLGLRGNIIAWINSFLRNKSYTLRVEGQSSTASSTVGVPQGGVLSPLLFNLTIDGVFRNLPKGVFKSGFADDLSLRCLQRTPAASTDRLQVALNRVAIFLTSSGLTISAEKSAVMVVAKNPRVDRGSVVLTINGSPLPIVRVQKFLGLHFDDRLSWRRHVDYLASKSSKVLSLLKFFTSRSGGASQNALISLYKSLLRSRLDYGCQALDSATNSIKLRIERIQNKALRIALGMPQNTAISGLQIEADVPPLQLRRDYFVALTLLKDSSRGGSLSSWRFRQQIWRNNQVPFPASARHLVRHLALESAYLQVDHTILHPSQPPWTSPPSNVEFRTDWLQGSKDDFPAPTLHRLFLEELHSTMAADLTLYTDASKIPTTGACGLGVYCPSTGQSESRRLPLEMSICSAELTAILFSLQLALTSQPRSVRIVSDSLSALETLKDFGSTSGIVADVWSLTQQFERVTFLWAPSHVGIHGNERADQLATGSVHLPNISEARIPILDVKRATIKALRLQWGRMWIGQTTGRLLHSIKPFPIKWPHAGNGPRPQDVALTSLRCNRACLPSYLYTIDKRDDPDCDFCLVPGTPEHYLLYCDRYHDQRDSLDMTMRALDIELSLKSVLGGADLPAEKQLEIKNAVVRFIQDTVGLWSLRFG